MHINGLEGGVWDGNCDNDEGSLLYYYTDKMGK